MQSNIVMAFRKRLKRWGYRDISIRQYCVEGIPSGEYSVIATEPLAGMKVCANYTLAMMHHAFKCTDQRVTPNLYAATCWDTAQQVTLGEVFI